MSVFHRACVRVHFISPVGGDWTLDTEKGLIIKLKITFGLGFAFHKLCKISKMKR